MSVDHQQRVAQLELVARHYDLKLYGSGLHTLPASSPLHRCYQGEVWGVEMYQVLRTSRITLNSHIDMAGREAGNMRLFEATGAGSFLLTDDKDNMPSLFERDREVAVWTSVDDCLSEIKRALDDEDWRQSVAQAGQARTRPAYLSRTRTISSPTGRRDAFAPMTPRPLARRIAARIIRAIPVLRRQILVSTDYRVLSGIDEARRLQAASSGWLAGRTVTRQERAYLSLLKAMKRGEPRLDLRIAAEAVVATQLDNPSLIEVGCGSGYYSDVFAELAPVGLRYTGIDYSEAMIARARQRYPSGSFRIADATRLPYDDDAFDIVFNGVSLMHIVDYERAIREAARVAKRYCILHSVPVFGKRETTCLQKYAYGSPVVEIVFNRDELISLCEAAGLRLDRQWRSIPYDVSAVTGDPSWTETYLLSVT
ncbi:glycosyltransferase family protein [Bradyrhizobium sp. RDM12]